MKLITCKIISLAVMAATYANCTTISFDTATPSEWKVTAGGAVNVTPYSVAYNAGPGATGNAITVTSDSGPFGTFLPGGSLANFDGYWTAVYTFSLPANASNVQLNFANLFADGRAVMMLNGTIFSSAGYPTPGGTFNGFMVFTDGSAPVPYAFNGPFGNVSGTVNTGFNIGGLNTIEAIVNNTPDSVAGAMVGLSPFDGTGLGITGAITYSIVPEPSISSLGFFGALIVYCGLFVRRNKQIAH